MRLKNEDAIDLVLKSRKILITCGTGGVGKTTLSAALAIRAALLGLKTVVITIDPAKRLANALGLSELSDHPTDLTPQIEEVYEKKRGNGQVFPPYFPQKLTGTLAAIVPDTRQTFESFVRGLAPSPAAAERVMRNPIYQIFAKEFSGTNEYMALERLLALYQLNQFDCIILDTPPSRNTLAFLDAPHLLARFFDEKLIRWLVLPANQWVSAGIKKALGILESLTGAGFMAHLFEFASALFEVQVKFSANLNKINHLLKSQEVGFLVATTPTLETIPEVKLFIKALHHRHFHFDGVILNRCLSYLKKENPQATRIQDSPLDKAFAIVEALQAREKKVFEVFLENSKNEKSENLIRNQVPLCAKLPELARDVHSVEDLFHVALAFNTSPTSELG